MNLTNHTWNTTGNFHDISSVSQQHSDGDDGDDDGDGDDTSYYLLVQKYNEEIILNMVLNVWLCVIPTLYS